MARPRARSAPRFSGAGLGRHGRADGRHHRCASTFGNKSVERLFVIRLLSALRRLRAVHRLCLFQLWRPGHAGRLPHSDITARLGAGRPDLRQATISSARSSSCRCSGTSPASRRGHRGRSAGPLAMIPALLFFIRDGRLLSRGWRSRPCRRTSARADRHSGVPPAVSADDLLGLAGERRRARSMRSTSGSTRPGKRTQRQAPVAPRAADDRAGPACRLHVPGRPVRTRCADRQRLPRARLHPARRLRRCRS